MLESVTGDDIFASVCMLVADPKRPTIVLLESTDDCKCVGLHVDPGKVVTLPCYGKTNLLRATSLIDLHGVQGALGIRDRDLTGIVEILGNSANLVRTDLYDLDATILLETEIGRRVIRMYANEHSVQQWCSHVGVATAIDGLVRLTAELGRLRAVSTRDGIALSLERFPLHIVADFQDCRVERATLIALAFRRSANASGDQSQVAASMDSINAPDKLLCCGHDLARTLAGLLAGPWGGAHPKSETLLRAARAALSCGDLRATQLYADVDRWSRRTGWEVWNCDAG